MYIKFKRILALVMTLTMLFTAFQTTAFAQDDNSFTVEAVNDDENTNEKSSETENLEQETSEATNAQTPEQSVEQTPEQSVEQTPVVEEPVIEGDVLEGDVLEPEVLPNLAPSSDLSQGTETGENLENVNLNNMTLHLVPKVNPDKNVDDDLEVVVECDTNKNHNHVCEDHPKYDNYEDILDDVIPKQVMEGPVKEHGRWTVYLGFTDSQISEFANVAKLAWGVDHNVTPEDFFENLKIKYVWDYDDWEWDLADRSLVDYHKDYHDDDDHDDNDDLVIRYTCNPVKPDKPSILEDVNVILRCLTKDDGTNHTDINRFDGVLTKTTFYEEQISDVSYNEKEQKWEVVATFDDYQIRNFKKIADNVWQMEHTFEGNREITFQYDEKTGTWTAVGSQTKDGEIILDYRHVAIEPEKEYKITFYPGDNGTILGETQTTVVDGNKINWVPEAEPNEGWIFIGWKDDNGNTYTSEDVKNVVPTTDMNFTAQYEKDEPIVPGNNVDEIRVVISGDLKNQIKDTFGELISVVHLNERGGDGKTDYLMLTTPNAGGYYREYAPKGLTLENWTEYYESIIPVSTLVWEENPCYGTNPMDEHIVDIKYQKENQWYDPAGLFKKIDVLTIYLGIPEQPPVEPEYTDITVEKTVNGIDTKDIGSFEFVLTNVETGEETEFTINEFTENKATTVIPKLVVGKTYTISEKADSTVRDGYEFKGVSVNGNVLSEENGRYSYTFIAGETVTVSFDNTYEMIPKSPVDEIRVVISDELKDQINDKFLEFISVVHLNERGGDGENDYLRLITLNFGEYYKAKAPEGLTLENWTEYYESVIPVSSMLWEENPCYGTDPMDEHIVDVKYTEENGLCGKTNILTIYLGVPDDENPENPENPIEASGIKVYNMIADANGITLKENPTDVVFNFRIDKLNAEGGTEAIVGEGTNKDGGKVEFTSYVEKLADGDYRVLEVVTTPEDENWIYDTTIYNFTVKDGKASVQAGINFVNKLKDDSPVIGGDIKVVFNKGNAGNIENFPDGSVAVVVDKGTKLETKDVPNIIPDTNYRFVGWKDDATGTIYTSENILEIVVENNMSFTAQYEYTGGSSSGGGGGGSGSGRTIEDEDVPLANLNLEDHFGYVVGYPDGTVRPNDYITREEVATIFFRLIDDYSREEYWSTTNSYTDTVPTDWSNNAVSTLEKSNIISGYPDGTFRGDNYITRAEFAVISARFDETPYVGDDLFTDISGHWAQEYINRAGNRGWLHGYSDGTFAPNKYITRAEAFTLINAVLGRTPNNESLCDGMVTFSDNPKGTWYYAQIQEATNSHNVAEPVEGETNEVWTEVIPMRDWKAIEQPSNKTFIPDPYAPEIPDLSEVTE